MLQKQRGRGSSQMDVNRVNKLWKFLFGFYIRFSGVVKHVGDALFAKSPKAKSDIVCIGFSPWGVVEGRENLIGVNVRNIPIEKILFKEYFRNLFPIIQGQSQQKIMSH